MIPADRERLSQLLDTADQLLRRETERNGIEIGNCLDQARAIVDQPATTTETAIITECPQQGIGDHDRIEHLDHQIEIVQSRMPHLIGAPNPHLDAFLTEPIHEYTDPSIGKPEFGRIRHPLGWTRPERRHRALSPLKLALALTLATIGLIAATTLTTPTGGTERPNPESRPAKQPPAPSQTGFWPNGPTLTPPGAP